MNAATQTSRKPRKQRKVTDGNLTFTEKTAAKKLGIAYITLFRKRQAGLIPFYRIGSRILYDDACLTEFLRRNLQGNLEGVKAA